MIVFDPEAAVRSAVANAAIEGIVIEPVFVERLLDVAEGTISADALIAEELARLQSSQ